METKMERRRDKGGIEGERGALSRKKRKLCVQGEEAPKSRMASDR
jgi:hypothetical protein